MRKILVCALVALGITAGGASVPASAGSTEDVRARVSAIPGMRFLKETTEKVPAGFRHLLFSYRQPVDHRRPKDGTFEQRFVLLHKAFDRPVVFETVGYGLYEAPYRLEVTRLVDGNQLMPEHRFFPKSRPERVDWSKLDIWQAASDHHRLLTAVRGLYTGKWVSTGASKNGMSAVYHRRFYPGDVDGTIPYVAPNDVDNTEDSAYQRFFDTVGTPECRQTVKAFGRTALKHRDAVVPRLRKDAEAKGDTYRLIGGLDRAYEVAVQHKWWAIWQLSEDGDCLKLPVDHASADDFYQHFRTTRFLENWKDGSSNFEDLGPYWYQAETQLGDKSLPIAHLRDLLRFPPTRARDFIPADIPRPTAFQPGVMADIDAWVRGHGQRLLFLYAENDPWSAERFTLGTGSRESVVYTAPGKSHWAAIEDLPATQRDAATSLIRSWAGVPANQRASQPKIRGFDDVNPLRRHPLG